MRARTSKKITIAIAHAIPFIINKTLDPRSPRLYPTKANIEDIIKPTAGIKSVNALAMVQEFFLRSSGVSF